MESARESGSRVLSHMASYRKSGARLASPLEEGGDVYSDVYSSEPSLSGMVGSSSSSSFLSLRPRPLRAMRSNSAPDRIDSPETAARRAAGPGPPDGEGSESGDGGSRDPLDVSPQGSSKAKGVAASPHSSPCRSPSSSRNGGQRAAPVVSGSAGGGEGNEFNVWLGAAMSLAYASFIFCRSFFTLTQAKMKADPAIQLTDVQANTIITSFGMAFGLAKFPAGILVNAVPPRRALLAFMGMTSLAVALAASPWCDSYRKIWFIAMLNALPQAGAYPAVTKLVCKGFAPEHHSSVFSLISIGSRAGQVAVSVVLGEVLRRTGSWRAAVSVSPLIVLVAMVLVLLLTNRKTNTPAAAAAPPASAAAPASAAKAANAANATGAVVEVEPLSVRLGRLALNPRFWLVNLSASLLLISKGFDTYAVRYISDMCEHAHPAECGAAAAASVLATHGTVDGESSELTAELTAERAPAMCLCKAYAPQLTAGVSMGIVASLFFGSYVYEQLKSGGRARYHRGLFIVALCGLNLVVACALYLFTVSVLSHGGGGGDDAEAAAGSSMPSQESTLVKLGLYLFMLGFSSGYPFYVPQSLFAVEVPADAATVVGCGECLQSVFGAAFILTAQHFAIGDGGDTDWVVIWTAVVIAAGGGFLSMVGFMYESVRAHKAKKKQKAA